MNSKTVNMDGEPTKADRSLLERLNALKPSSVQLERQKKPVDIASPSSSGVSSLDRQSRNSLHSGVGFSYEYDMPLELFPENGDSIEYLLSTLDRSDNLPRTLGVGYMDTQRILSDANRPVNCPEASVIGLNGGSVDSQFNPGSDWTDRNNGTASDDESDDQKAAKYAENLLTQIGLEDHQESSQLSSTSQDMKASLKRNLPFDRTSFRSTPGSDPQESCHITKPESTSVASAPVRRENDDDVDLSTSLAALSLPSVPAQLPGESKATPIAGDDLAPDCCCICYDNATTKCLDCDGAQFFCVRCWWEMHMGEGACSAERQHRRVKY